MEVTPQDISPNRRSIRLWPGMVFALLLILVRFFLPLVAPDALILSILGGLACALAIIVWWLLFSRVRWSERLGVIAIMIAAMIATARFIHVSVATGMMGMMFPFYAVPFLSLGLVGWAIATRRVSNQVRWGALFATILIVCGAWTMVRTGGISGDGKSDFHWRWSKTPEELLLAQTEDKSLALDRNELTKVESTLDASTPIRKEAQWLGFRGSRRDGVVHGTKIESDWKKFPPLELWRRAIGPGWSSFAVDNGLIFTQEQRGDDEVVSCYSLTSGELVWKHSDKARFWESNAGAGPRGTPTINKGRVYSLGATGIVNAMDAASGELIWSNDAAADTGAKRPGWGFSGSPLVVNDLVFVAASGALAAYELETGILRWMSRSRGGSYSSPHFTTIQGTEQILLISGSGVSSFAPADGAELWDYRWPGDPIVQPAIVGEGDLLVTTAGAAGSLGMRRITVSQGPDGWTVKEKWQSMALKPYFNDFVIHQGHAIGFDGVALACMDLADGKRKWKAGRYGNGQLILLSDQDLLIVVSESGDVALVSAGADNSREIARIPAIDGKTWNHPVLAGDVLLVRNGQEMVAFQLSLNDR